MGEDGHAQEAHRTDRDYIADPTASADMTGDSAAMRSTQKRSSRPEIDPVTRVPVHEIGLRSGEAACLTTAVAMK